MGELTVSFANPGPQVMASGVEHGKVKIQLSVSYVRSDLDCARCQLHFPVLDDIHITQSRVI